MRMLLFRVGDRTKLDMAPLPCAVELGISWVKRANSIGINSDIENGETQDDGEATVYVIELSWQKLATTC